MSTPERLGVELVNFLDVYLHQEAAQARQSATGRDIAKRPASNRKSPKESPQHVNGARRGACSTMAFAPEQTPHQLILAALKLQAQLVTIEPDPGLLASIAVHATANNWQRFGRHPQEKEIRK